MHELGIVTHVMKTLTDVAAENELTRIGSVTLEVGEVSGVIHEQILDCWDYMCTKRGPLFTGCRLILETIPAVTYCSSCGKTYPTVQYGRTCPHCGSGETWLQEGNECTIKEIEAE